MSPNSHMLQKHYMYFQMALQSISDILSCPDISSDDNKKHLQIIIDSRIVSKMVDLLSLSKDSIVEIATFTLTMIAGGSNDQKQVLIDFNIINLLVTLYKHKRQSIREVATLCISNIASGSHEQKHALMCSDLLPKIIENISKSEPNMQKKAMRIIDILLTDANKNIVKQFVQAGAVRAFLNVAKSDQVNFADVGIILKNRFKI